MSAHHHPKNPPPRTCAVHNPGSLDCGPGVCPNYLWPSMAAPTEEAPPPPAPAPEDEKALEDFAKVTEKAVEPTKTGHADNAKVVPGSGTSGAV